MAKYAWNLLELCVKGSVQLGQQTFGTIWITYWGELGSLCCFTH